MSLWMHWWNAIWRLRPAFSRLQTFLWFATAVAGFTVRTELLGVTSIVRALKLDTRCYNTLLDGFHSSAVKLDRLTKLWSQVVLRLFPQPVRVNGRCVLVGDGVAYTAYQQRGPRKPGRPRVYGRKIKLSSLLQASRDFQQAPSPVYGEHKVIIQYRVRDLLWRPAGRLVRFVAVIHPVRGACLLMCTHTSLDAFDIIRLYGLRFKIEHTFKQAVRQIGAFAYHFWMSDMKPLRRNNGNQHLHRESLEYRNAIKRKIHAYHVFIQAGVVCQGLLQYLAVAFPQLVWTSFGSWLRTIRPGIPPSELVVATALRQSLPEFLLDAPLTNIFAKFVMERQESEKWK